MFVSLPDYKFYIPPGLALPDATYWRCLGLSTSSAWYVLTLRQRIPDAGLQTFLLMWDTDIADAISSLDADLEGLLVVAPYVSGKQSGWFSTQVKEVWEGTDPLDDDNPCIVFVDEEGKDYSGFFMQQAGRIKRSRLITRVRAASSRTTRSSSN